MSSTMEALLAVVLELIVIGQTICLYLLGNGCVLLMSDVLHGILHVVFCSDWAFLGYS